MFELATPALDDISAILRRVEEAAYKRGKADAKNELLVYLNMAAPSVKSDEQNAEPRRHRAPIRSAIPAQDRLRAPKGAARNIIYRTLSAEPELTPRQILDRAETDFEKMIKLASIRGELRVGRLLGTYENNEGRWSLTSHHKEETEGRASQLRPSASHH